MAIEHAAGLANALHRSMVSHGTRERLSEQEITSALKDFSQAHASLLKTTTETSQLITRIHSRQGRLLSFVGRYLVPNLGSLMVCSLCWLFADSVALEYMRFPAGSKRWPTWMDWHRWQLAVFGSIFVAVGISLWLGLSVPGRVGEANSAY